jgi:hypothetical protein
MAETDSREEKDYRNLTDILASSTEEVATADPSEEQTEQESEESENEESESEEPENEETEEDTEEEPGDETEEEESEEDVSDVEDSDVEDVKLPIWADKIKGVFPDRTFDSLEDYDNAISEHVDTLEKAVETNKQSEAVIIGIFEQHPEIADMVKLMAKGYSPRAALIHAGFTPEDFNVEDGDEDAEQLVEAKIKQKQEAEKRKADKARIESNSRKSQEVIDTFQKTKGIKDSVRNEFLAKVEDVFNSFLDANIKPETLEMFWKALNYDSDVRKADSTAFIRGRNEKIQIEKKKKKGDGVPKLNAGFTPPRVKSQIVYDDPFAEALDRINKSNI